MIDETNETRMIKLDYIYFDSTTQPRLHIDMSTVEDYAAAMAAGDEFPPIECGNSQIGEAAIRMGRDFIGFEADPQRAGEIKQRLAALADEDDGKA